MRTALCLHCLPEHVCGGTRTGRLDMTSSCLVRHLTAGQAMPRPARRSFIADRGREDVRADEWGSLVGISPCNGTQRGGPYSPCANGDTTPRAAQYIHMELAVFTQSCCACAKPALLPVHTAGRAQLIREKRGDL